MKIKWERFGGYEVSSKGDKRFSAFYARMPDGRTIEQHYQCDVKGYDPGGTNWRLGKGKPPKTSFTPDELLNAYVNLWRTWAKGHRLEIQDLYQKAKEYKNTLSDKFGTTPVNQAHALAIILNETYMQ